VRVSYCHLLSPICKPSGHVRVDMYCCWFPKGLVYPVDERFILMFSRFARVNYNADLSSQDAS
jgi:hypothetical protein